MNKHFHLFIFAGCMAVTSLAFANSVPTSEDQTNQNLIPAFEAQYDLHRKGDKVGKVHRKLIPTDGNNWQFTMKSKGGVFLFSVEYFQESHFSWVDGIPRPAKYQQSYSNSFKSAKKNKQLFDWEQMLETGSYHKNNWQLELTPGIQDRLTSILCLRLDLLLQDQKKNQQKGELQQQDTFQYPVSYKGKIKEDMYQLMGEEKVSTPAGDFETLHVKKIHQNKSRVSFVWLAKELNYLPVRIKQFNEGKEQADMLLNSVSYDLRPKSPSI